MLTKTEAARKMVEQFQRFSVDVANVPIPTSEEDTPGWVAWRDAIMEIFTREETITDHFTSGDSPFDSLPPCKVE